ncbi:MAG: hypothetical protein EOM79_04435 [Epsilonproteobacteria bacterium]|nr:hypothetical protein [Campylobacterota bacterium]
MKNRAFFVIILFGTLFIAQGCGYLADKKGGIFPSESYNEYMARLEREGGLKEEEVGRRKTTFEEVASRTPRESRLERRPNKGLNYTSGFGPGVEVDNFGDTTTIITPRLWGMGKDYDDGARREKKRHDRWILQEEERLARERGREDAYGGAMNFEGVPLKFLQTYEREFERTRNSLQRQAYHDRSQRDYRRGQEDYRQNHPDYREGRRIIIDVRRKARRDAQTGVYNPPKIYKREYDEIFRRAMQRMHRYR